MPDHKAHRRKSSGSWGKWLLIAVAVLALLLVAVYFLATSAFFLKRVILPKASAALNADITVGDASISPFSRVQLTKVRVMTTGPEPLMTVEEVRLRYSLMDIIKGNINVDELTLSSPVIHVVQEPDGSSNLDPLLEKDQDEGEEPSKSDEPLKLDIKNFALKNGTVRQTVKLAEGGTKETAVQNLNVTLDHLANGESGKLTVDGDLTMAQRSGGTNDLLKAGISGGYDIAWTEDLLPQSASGSLKLAVTDGQGAYQEAAGLATSLDADLTPNEIREVALKFTREGQDLGRVRVSGPFDVNRKEGNLKIEVVGIDRNLLNIATAGQGMDFRDSRINFVNQVAISQEATFFAANGSLMGRQLTAVKGEMATPVMDLNVEYQVTVNLNDKTAVLQKLSAGANHDGYDFLRAGLDRQMNLSWGNTVRGYKDASLSLVLTNLNLADWRAVIGTNVNSGLVNVRAAVVSERDGKLLKTDLQGRLSNLTAHVGTNLLSDAAVSFSAIGTVEELKVINFSNYSFTLQQNNADVLQANGAARYSLENNDVSAQITAEGALPRLIALADLPDISATAGKLKVSGTVADAGGKRTANGTVGIEEFVGAMKEYRFNNFQVALEYTAVMEGQVVDIQRAAATFSQGFNAGGSVDAKGRYDIEKESGTISYKVVNLNENTFRPFLAPSLGEKKLVSISMNGAGEARLDPKGETAVLTELNISNWQVEDAGKKIEPLSVGLKLDAGLRDQIANVRQASLQLSPTQRAKNVLQLQGQIDLRTNNAAPSSLTLSSESFDVTPYYNLFAGGEQTGRTTGSTTTPTPTTSTEAAVETEPEPLDLPFKDFTANLKLDRVFLNEIAISNWTGSVAIKNNNVRIDPFQMNVNGGPVSINGIVDVGVPGYRYDLSFNAENVPLEPLANSFTDTNNAGQLQGNLIANARITGEGTSGPNLQKNLGGNASFNLTNLNYQIVGPKLRRILVPIAAVLRAPELTQTPINWAAGVTVISNGVVNLQKLDVQSEAFLAEVQGAITMEPVLTNSILNLPLDLSLRRSLAEKAKMLPSNTPPDAKYAKLPRFVTVRGTLGAPEPDINKLALGSQLLRSAQQLGIGNEKTEEILGTLGNLGARISGGGTNQPANGTNNVPEGTNSAPGAAVGNLLRGILGGDAAQANESQGTTNAPATNAPARTNPLDLFRNLQKDK